MKPFTLLPGPEKAEMLEGVYCFPPKSILVMDRLTVLNSAKKLKRLITDSLKKEVSIMIREEDYDGRSVRFVKKEKMPSQGYELSVQKDGILIYYGGPEGAFYAVSTLKQLIICCKNELPCLHIADKPAFTTRGLMIDISRCKVPKIGTLYQIADLMGDLKLNQMQLYIEGFSFAYPSFPDYWRNLTPITGEEIMELDRYCRDRYIDLVPNQNTFGHMEPWLMTKEFHSLAECENGFTFQNVFIKNPRCLNPLDPRSIELVRTMTDDLLCYFTSEYYNVCCDETLELGQGKSKETVEKVGLGRVYLDHLLKIHEIAKAHGKRMMFWGDIIKEYPELVKELPKDVIALEWGYAPSQPTEESCAVYRDAGVPFYVCPGTNSWNAVLGKTDKMLENIRRAAVTGQKYGAIGLLNTDWGDEGHWHPLPVSYAGFAYGAAMSWGPEKNQSVEKLEDFLNAVIFQDANKKMGRFVLEAGNYFQLEDNSPLNITKMVELLYRGFEWEGKDNSIESLRKIIDYLNRQRQTFESTDLRCGEAPLIYNEYDYALRLVTHAAKHGIFKTLDADGRRKMAAELHDDMEDIIFRFQSVWLQRNKPSRMAESLQNLEGFKKGYESYLK